METRGSYHLREKLLRLTLLFGSSDIMKKQHEPIILESL